jgi:hypothetical protein
MLYNRKSENFFIQGMIERNKYPGGKRVEK